MQSGKWKKFVFINEIICLNLKSNYLFAILIFILIFIYVTLQSLCRGVVAGAFAIILFLHSLLIL